MNKKKAVFAAASAALILCLLTGCRDAETKVGAEQTDPAAVTSVTEDCCHKDEGCENDESCKEKKDCCSEHEETAKDCCQGHEDNTDSGGTEFENIANCCG